MRTRRRRRRAYRRQLGGFFRIGRSRHAEGEFFRDLRNRCQPGVQGFAFSNASAGFSDEWRVQGAGLAGGAPVTLIFTVRIAGRHSGASRRGAASVALSARDVGVNGPSQNIIWASVDHAARDYPWGCNTFIGRTLAGRRGHRQPGSK